MFQPFGGAGVERLGDVPVDQLAGDRRCEQCVTASGDAYSVQAEVLGQPAAVSAYTLTAGRLWSVVAALFGVAGVIVGGLALALARSAGRSRRPIVAIVSGLTGAVIGGLVVVAAKGGPGTGYGIVGGYVALVVSVTAMVLGGLALVRARRTV